MEDVRPIVLMKYELHYRDKTKITSNYVIFLISRFRDREQNCSFFKRVVLLK